MKHLLLCVDLTPSSAGYLLYAFAFAERTGMRVDVLHAYRATVPPTSRGLASTGEEDLAALRAFDAQHAAALRGLDALLKPYQGSPARGRALAACGYPVDVIVETARELGSDLIMVGRRSHFWAGTSLGRVATSVVRAAPCDVLVMSPAQAVDCPEEDQSS